MRSIYLLYKSKLEHYNYYNLKINWCIFGTEAASSNSSSKILRLVMSTMLDYGLPN